MSCTRRMNMILTPCRSNRRNSLWSLWSLCSLWFTTVLIAMCGATLVAQNGSQFKDWKASLVEAKAIEPHASCASLVALTGFELSVTTASVIPASAEAPEFCRVSGQIQPEIRFEISLPSAWNGRLYMFGNGGY